MDHRHVPLLDGLAGDDDPLANESFRQSQAVVPLLGLPPQGRKLPGRMRGKRPR